MAIQIPETMKAIRYNKPGDWELITTEVPKPRDNEVLIQVKSCGVCGTDLHIHDGEFESDMPLITGHEISGLVAQIGRDVKGFQIGDKVTADCSTVCGHCHFCQRGKALLCENFKGHGQHLNGGFAEFCVITAAKLFPFKNLSWEEASLLEATACAVHGLDSIKPDIGSRVIILGAGATGLCLAQLLRLNGGSHITIASNAGPKMALAKSLNVADEYFEFDRDNPAEVWKQIKEKSGYGYDIVIEATGSHQVLQGSIALCSRGGTLLFYGVYHTDATIQLSPSRVMLDELKFVGSLSQIFCMPRAVHYLDSGKVNVKGIVTHTYSLDQFGEALDAIRAKKCVKATIMMK